MPKYAHDGHGVWIEVGEPGDICPTCGRPAYTLCSTEYAGTYEAECWQGHRWTYRVSQDHLATLQANWDELNRLPDLTRRETE